MVERPIQHESRVLIWRYGAACSSFKIFAAPAAQNAAPGGVKDMGVAER